MAFHWDSPSDQRGYFIKIVAAWMGAILVAGLPVWMAVSLITL
ncbi:MAG: hypothetical protein PW791_01610 [Neorhizobium sp.]|nr:hypothetical protein [Neorhizobium sp.]